MSTSIHTLQPLTGWELPVTKPLDETLWRAWVIKGRVRERQDNIARTRALKWAVVVALLGATVLTPVPAPFQILLRFVVAIAAVVVMFQAIHARRYGLAAVFGALLVIYNPVAPPIHFSTDWQRALLAASAIPFAAPLLRIRKHTDEL